MHDRHIMKPGGKIDRCEGGLRTSGCGECHTEQYEPAQKIFHAVPFDVRLPEAGRHGASTPARSSREPGAEPSDTHTITKDVSRMCCETLASVRPCCSMLNGPARSMPSCFQTAVQRADGLTYRLLHGRNRPWPTGSWRNRSHVRLCEEVRPTGCSRLQDGAMNRPARARQVLHDRTLTHHDQAIEGNC